MKLNELLSKPLEDILEQCNILKLNPISDESGDIIKIIIEYVPQNIK